MGYNLHRGLYPFPLSYLASDGGNYNQDFVDGDTSLADDTEPNFYVLCVTADEWTKIKSSVQVGAPIAYPDSYNEPLQLIWQANEFPNQIPEDSCMDICQFILDCIETNTDVQDAINNLISINTQNNSYEYGQSQSDLILGDGNNPTCDLDTLWGGISYLIEATDRQNVDWLEQFEVATNLSDFVASVVGDITIIDETSADALLAWVEYIQDNIAENYVAQVTQNYLDELSCDLFCLAKETCELTPQMIYDYFMGRLGGAIQFTSLISNALDYIVAGSWSGTEIADAFFMSNLMMRANFGRIFEFVGFNSFDTSMRLGMLEPSNAWEITCDDCGWYEEFDFTVSDGGWSAIDFNGYGDRGSWQNGVGWVASDVQHGTSGYRRVVNIEIDIADTDLTKTRVTYDYVEGNSVNGGHIAQVISWFENDTLQSSINKTFNQMADGDAQTYQLTDTDIVDNLMAYLASSSEQSATYSGTAIITKIEVWGTGTNPF